MPKAMKRHSRVPAKEKAGSFGERKLFAALLMTALFLSACGVTKEMETLRTEAIARYEAGAYSEARALFDEALMAGKGQVSEFQFDLLRYRGECELRLGDLEAAKKTYEALLVSDEAKENQAVYEEITKDLENLDFIRTAVSDMEKGEYEKAYEALDAYAVLDGTLLGKIAYYNKAVCAEYMQSYDEAYEMFNHYLKEYPEDEAAQKEFAFLKTR